MTVSIFFHYLEDFYYKLESVSEEKIDLTVESVHEWITESTYYTALDPFFKNNIHYIVIKNNDVYIEFNNDIKQFFYIQDEFDNTYYKIPYHKLITLKEYYRYFSLLYTCHNQFRVYDEPEYNMSFIGWVFLEMIGKQYTFESKYDKIIISPCSLWKLIWYEEDSNWMRQSYDFEIIEQEG